ncbi:uncharacterized protein [Montipora capricornis]|uniref:uncharacterized protein n=1 Tax=Montipora capricornis TaxID=246305 RepID=UPI0035F20E99
MVVTTKEYRSWYDKSAETAKITKKPEVTHYHVNPTCISSKNAAFQASLHLSITPDDRERMLEVHKNFLQNSLNITRLLSYVSLVDEEIELLSDDDGGESDVSNGVTDSECKFLDASAGYPGSVHDARIFRRSDLFRQISTGDIMGGTRVINNVNVRPYLIGDTAYPLRPYLMTAYHSGRLTPPQQRFNKVLTKLRVVVERAYGKLKMRWRCILKELEDDTQRVADITLACCILHNFCIIMGDDFDDSDEDESSDDDDDDGREDDDEGQEIRRALTEDLSQ